MNESERIAAIVGPTASGKTAAVVALREQFGLPIEAVNIDALQIYRQFNAGTAKPDAAERAAVPTWLLDIADPTEAWHAARHMVLADQAIADIRGRGAWPVVVGGTGLYLRALLRGLADIPEVPAILRQQLATEWQQRGGAALHAELAIADPAYAAITPAQNRQRVLRALEVWRATGRPFSAWHGDHAGQADRYACLLTVLDPPRDVLQDRIDARAKAMAEPLLAEVQALLAGGLSPEAPAMQAIGYRQAATALAAGTSRAEFTDELLRAHRQYGKRQGTWFRRENAQLRLESATGEDLQRLAVALRAWFDPK